MSEQHDSCQAVEKENAVKRFGYIAILENLRTGTALGLLSRSQSEDKRRDSVDRARLGDPLKGG